MKIKKITIWHEETSITSGHSFKLPAEYALILMFHRVFWAVTLNRDTTIYRNYFEVMDAISL